MTPSFYLVAGAIIGGSGRYLAALAATRALGEQDRLATPLTNIAGSFILGFLSVLALRSGTPHDDSASIPGSASFIAVGICAGFAIISFSRQTLELLRGGTSASAASNVLNAIVLSVAVIVLCIIAATLGHASAVYLGVGKETAT